MMHAQSQTDEPDHAAVQCRRLLEPDAAMFVDFLRGFPTTAYRQWDLLFTHGWNRIDGTVGFGLFEGPRTVGYLGTIQTQRTIGGVSFRNVNLSTWYVLKEYRAHSLDPQRAVLDYEQCVSVGHTIIPQIVKRYESIGYRGFDFHTRLLFYTPFARSSTMDGATVLMDDAVLETCTDDERVFIKDHAPYGCVPFLFQATTGESCLIIAQRVIRRYKKVSLPTAHCLYVSNREFFAEINSVARNVMMRRLKCALVALDERFLLGRTAQLSMKIPLITPRMSRNDIGFDPVLLDNLYTELALMRY